MGRDNKIVYNGQPVALVVTNTFERALYAASLVQAQYTAEKHDTKLTDNLSKAFSPHDDNEYKRGTVDAWQSAPVKLEQEYLLPSEVHNPMEMHAIVAQWDADDKITVWDKTQGVKDCLLYTSPSPRDGLLSRMPSSA